MNKLINFSFYLFGVDSRGDAHSQDLKFPYIVLKIKACIKPTNNQEKSVIISLIIILGVVLLSCRMGMNSVDFIPNLISKINRTDSISNITQTNETAQTYKTVPTYKTAEEVLRSHKNLILLELCRKVSNFIVMKNI